MKCPVCKTEIVNSCTACPTCNFDDLYRVFINVDDAEEWKNSVLAHHRALWILRNKETSCIDLDSDESKDIFQRYCTDKSHVYRIGKLLINTKFACFIWESEENGHKKREVQLFGYECFHLGYEIKGDAIEFYMQDKDDADTKHSVGTITTSNENTQKEVLTIFEFMKTGGLHFEYAFDESVKWYQVKNTDNYYMMKNYFSGPSIVPFTFCARYIEVDDFADGNPVTDHGQQEIQFSVENENRATWSVSDMNRNAPKRLRITCRDLATNKSMASIIYLDDVTSINTKDDLYINEESMSVFIGEQYNYQQFQFEDLVTAHRAFDYLMILFSHSV